MKLRLFTCAAIGLLAAASAANAAITVVTPLTSQDLHGTTLAAHGQVMLDNFDDIDNPNIDYSGFTRTYQHPISDSAAPPYTGPGSVSICCVDGSAPPNTPLNVDATTYASVQAGATHHYTADAGYYLTSFSFYMGSPDLYNRVTFNLLGGGTPEVFQGNAIWGGNPGDPQGDRTLGFRVYYDFHGAKVSSIDFYSENHAFEYDGLAGTLAVPEPGTWSLMIGGFGMAGAMLRRRRGAIA
jgi:hypothetical protein